jgi:hypothetical protein
LASRYAVNESDMLRSQLSQIAPELFKVLDAQWQNYLALPAQLVQAGPHPSATEVEAAVQRYASVANDPRYQALAAYPEFKSVYALLSHYQQSLAPVSTQLNLPPPPSNGAILPP